MIRLILNFEPELALSCSTIITVQQTISKTLDCDVDKHPKVENPAKLSMFDICKCRVQVGDATEQGWQGAPGFQRFRGGAFLNEREARAVGFHS